MRIHWVSSSGQSTRGGPSAWELGDVPTTPHSKTLTNHETFHKASELDSSIGTTQAVENEISWACGTYGKQDRYIQDFGGKT